MGVSVSPSKRAAGPQPSASIHDAKYREQYLDEIRRGAKRHEAATTIGCSSRSVQRYIAMDQDFAARLLEAERTAPRTRVEVSHQPPPVTAMTRVVVDGEPVDSVTCEGTSERRAEPGQLEKDYEASVAEIAADPDHKHFGKIADILERRFHGVELIRAVKMFERELARLPAEDRPSCLVIRYPERRE